jgi:translation elongation factor IF5A
MSAHDYDENFESTDSGASLTTPTTAGDIKKNAYMVFNGRPCKVVDISFAKTGKHGHAKASITGVDIFNGRKYEDSVPSSHGVEAPIIKRTEWQAIAVDADGYVYIHDRVKDMIVSGGENVYPAEVENVLMSHPGIADVAVIGIPHEKWGETALAVVVKAPGVDVTEDEIIEFSRERLARFKCPTQVQWIDVLPRNPSGKVLKKDLREPYWAGRERRVN